jgi:uncharacterized BrkB/YihY/UPF0761 family membrane protein
MGIGGSMREATAPVRERGVGATLRGVVERFREADGTSHSRALAYQVVFVVVSGFIGLVGLASVLGVGFVRDTVVEMSTRIAPGPSSRLLEEAARQGSNGGTTAMLLGLGSALVAGTFAMAQVERSGNRTAGVREDRPGVRRYVVALGLSLSAGVLIALGLLALGGGRAIASGAGWSGTAATVWTLARWPLGFLLAAAGVFVLFVAAPRDRIASTAAIAIGALVAVTLWVLFTIGLAIYFAVGEGNETYGSLLAVIALVTWAGASAIALHVGIATAVELDRRAAPGAVVSIPEVGATADVAAGDGARARR